MQPWSERVGVVTSFFLSLYIYIEREREFLKNFLAKMFRYISDLKNNNYQARFTRHETETWLETFFLIFHDIVDI